MQKTIPTSVRLDPSNKTFLKLYVRSVQASESEVMNKALDLFRKYHLRRELAAESEENHVRDKKMASEDFDSYHRIIHEAEAI